MKVSVSVNRNKLHNKWKWKIIYSHFIQAFERI